MLILNYYISLIIPPHFNCWLKCFLYTFLILFIYSITCGSFKQSNVLISSIFSLLYLLLVNEDIRSDWRHTGHGIVSILPIFFDSSSSFNFSSSNLSYNN